MRKTIVLALLLTLSSVNADDLECDGCVHAEDIRGQAVTTQKLRKGAVTEGKLAPEVQRKLNGLVVTDGVGRKLPIELGYVGSDMAQGYYRLDDGGIVPISISRWLPDQPHQIFGVPWPGYSAITPGYPPGPAIFFTGAGCTGRPFMASYFDQIARPLFPLILMVDPAAPNRSRLVFRIGERVNEQLDAVSRLDSYYGCTEIDPDSPYPYLSDNDIARIQYGNGALLEPEFIDITLVTSFAWIPPLTISTQ